MSNGWQSDYKPNTVDVDSYLNTHLKCKVSRHPLAGDYVGQFVITFQFLLPNNITQK